MKKSNIYLFVVSACSLYVSALNNVNATVVNINSQINYLGNSIELFLEAGTYSVTPIGISDGGTYDAWNPWGKTTCADPSGCLRTNPTTVTGWINRYDVISADITNVSVNGTELVSVETAPAPIIESYFLPSTTGSRYSVADFLAYPDALTALSFSQTSTFTLSTAGLVGFSINDLLPLSDNIGGISLDVSAVPVPTAAWLFGSGLIGLVGVARRYRKPAVRGDD